MIQWVKLQVVPPVGDGISEESFISGLVSGDFETSSPPKPDLVLAQQACDFWVEGWYELGIQVSSAKLHTEFDPEEAYWYFVIELFILSSESIEYSVHEELKIIDKLCALDPLPTWFTEVDYVVITSRREHDQ